MKTVEFTPKCCQGDGAKFKGSVVIRLPKTVERYAYMQECGFKIDSSGNVEAASDNMTAYMKMLGFAEKHVEKVDITKEDGTKVETFDGLDTDPECEVILGEIAGQLLNGFRPSKN